MGNNYRGILPPWDNNMVLSFHKYWNNNDQQSISQAMHYRQEYNMPVWLGESGENSNVWFADAISLVEKNNIGWAWWPLKKLGFNNPLQIPTNPGYEAIVQYWRSGDNKPDTSSAYQSLMELAAGTNISHNIVRHNVIDAMMRQPHTTETLPFKQNTITTGVLFWLPIMTSEEMVLLILIWIRPIIMYQPVNVRMVTMD
jgi:endoglucanase